MGAGQGARMLFPPHCLSESGPSTKVFPCHHFQAALQGFLPSSSSVLLPLHAAPHPLQPCIVWRHLHVGLPTREGQGPLLPLALGTARHSKPRLAQFGVPQRKGLWFGVKWNCSQFTGTWGHLPHQLPPAPSEPSIPEPVGARLGTPLRLQPQGQSVAAPIQGQVLTPRLHGSWRVASGKDQGLPLADGAAPSHYSTDSLCRAWPPLATDNLCALA